MRLAPASLLVLLAALPHRPDATPVRAPAAECERGGDTASCARCHRQIADEWRDSAHAHAFTDPVYRAALAETKHPERCVGCHAPEPVHGRLGRMPAARADARDEGVRCSSCHAVGERIAGPFGAETDAHESQKHPAFTERGSVSLCASCHDTTIGPVHALARDFLDSGLAERGKSCIGCHMPRALRPIANDPETGEPTGPARDGRAHTLRGPDDPEFCASAFAIAVARTDGELELSVRNRAGHRVPGLDLRRFPLLLRQLDADGRTVAEERFVFSTENPILVQETRRFRIPLDARAARAETVLVHEFAGEVVAELSREAHTW